MSWEKTNHGSFVTARMRTERFSHFSHFQSTAFALQSVFLCACEHSE